MKYQIALHRSDEPAPQVTHEGVADSDEVSFAELARIVEQAIDTYEPEPWFLGVHLLVRPDRVEHDGSVVWA